MANILYKDLDIAFRKHPITGDILTLSDEESIKQSVKTLIKTNLYERVMHPELGSQVTGLLFELDSPATRIVLKDSIVNVLEQYEPRILVRDIKISVKDNAYNVKLIFSIIDFQTEAKIELLLNRVR